MTSTTSLSPTNPGRNAADPSHSYSVPESLPSYHDSQIASSVRPTTALSTIHESALTNSSGHQWLFLRTNTRPRKPESLPFLWEGDIITGNVVLDLREKTAESAKGVTISVVGSTTFVGRDENVFFKETQVLWTASPQGKVGKLQGKQTWTFRFPLPKQVKMDGNDGESKYYNLPPSFTLRASPVYVDYKLVVNIKRGFLKVDKALTTTFGYQPRTFAEAPSPLRQVAYAEGTPLLGPQSDPDGWKTLKPITVKGTTASNSSEHVEVQVTLAVACPTSYPIGSPVPLWITLRSEDTKALDLLARSDAIRVELVRSMATGANATDDTNTGRSDNYFSESEGYALWWSETTDPDHSRLETHERMLRGEIPLPASLKPSFIFPRCCVRYTIQLHPFVTEGWHNAQAVPRQGYHVSESIKVTSRPAIGVPRPRSDAPPGYDKAHPANYLKTVGLLENGNQRFNASSHSAFG